MGTNFNEVVHSEAHDVLVLFYAGWDMRIQHFIKFVYEEAAQKMKWKKSLVFAKLDISMRRKSVNL